MQIKDIALHNRKTGKTGIYSVCSAHPLIIEAAMEQAKKDNSPVLIEATANQVNQFGGYTGMKPKDFLKFVYQIAEQVNFPANNIILGGDHLGPVCWVNETADSAMSKACDLIQSYVEAGFKKIHLDCSMPCADDDNLSDETIANRAATLCEMAESTSLQIFGHSDIEYIVGTEVPPPGGATEELSAIDPTPVANVKNTIDLHKTAFDNLSLESAWQRVIGIVVQPGVEFDHTGIVNYQPKLATNLKEFILTQNNFIYEAHSTDYQNDCAFKSLINDHFAILKVGPAVTFALREALFALSYIEDTIIPIEKRSQLRDVCEDVMLESPSSWQRFYPVPGHKAQMYRQYSYSDRIRYYWAQPRLLNAVDVLTSNLNNTNIPLPLLSQFLPEQYKQIRVGALTSDVNQLIKAKIKQVTESYAQACWKQ